MAFPRFWLQGAVVAGVLGSFAMADEPPTKPTSPSVTKEAQKPAETEEQKAQREYEEYLKKQQEMLKEIAKTATHEKVKEVKVTSSKDAPTKCGLQTLCLGADDQVLALVAPPRSYGAPIKGGFGEVHVFDSAGEAKGVWKVNFHANSINSGPDGTVYVAGDGKVARFDKTGKMLGEPVELPHIAELFKDEAKLEKMAQETLDREKKLNEESKKATKDYYKTEIEKIEKKKEDERTKTEVRRLQQFKLNLENVDKMYGDDSKRTVKDVIASMTGRVRTVNGIAVSDTDVYIACGETAGWGYAIWRFDLKMENAKKVLSDVGGCCGQMDVQCCGNDLVVAENTKHQFARYTRDGKQLNVGGKRGTDTDPAGFTGCCNPMNTRACNGTGDVFTAESEGIVKRFTSAGKFVGVVGTVQIQGGCKNVSIGVSHSGNKVYFCDQPGSKFFILSEKAEKPETKGGK